MNYSKLGYVRKIARKFGLTKLFRFPQKIRKQLRIMAYAKNRYSLATLSLDNYSFKMLSEDGYEWARTQSFYDDVSIIKEISRRLKEGNSFWDVGSSIGLYSNYCSKIVGDTGLIICFEPESRSYKRLMENIDLNNYSNIKAYSVALGEKRMKSNLLVAPKASAGNHQLITIEEKKSQAQYQSVEIVTADEFILQESLPIPTVVKIDVEGKEESVILGAKETLSNPKCIAVIIEIHSSILDNRGDYYAIKRIIQHLKDCNYKKISWIDASHLGAYK